MGGGSWSASDHSTYTKSKSYETKTVDEIYASSLDPAMDPRKINLRESCDSVDKPESNAIIIGLDVTGSMSAVLDTMARTGLNELMTAIYDRQPVSNPQVMCMAIGDVECDQAPLQVTQFEADIRIAQQLEKLWLEGCGGGNNYESYTLPWLFAAQRTKIDCWDKRQKKGYIFTMGDEQCPPILPAGRIGKKIGGQHSDDYTVEDLYQTTSERYNIFHLIIEEGRHGREKATIKSWKDAIGQNVLLLDNHRNMAQTIVSTIQINEGMDPDEVTDSWTGAVSATVKRAVLNLRR